LKLKQKPGFKDSDIMPFLAKEQVFQPYLNLLFKSSLSITGHQIHKEKRDVNADLEILQIVEGKRNLIKFQIAVIYAHKKIGMLLCDLDPILEGEGTIFPDADFRDWIEEKLHMLYRATAQGVEPEKQTITPENIRVQDEDEVKSRLT
ncbi:hypothetical protein MKX01_014221, partial [Papaver californicum]